jgi:uncharacterized protein (TIGR02453 family)
MEFSGFPKETFTFLSALAANNSKRWFDDHRADYARYHLEPAKDFVAAIGPRLQVIAPDAQFEARVNGSIFRINRDVRFSKDKRPYKTTLDMWFWQGLSRGWESPGFWLRLTPQEWVIGAGMHSFTPPQIARVRAAFLDDRTGEALERIEAGLAPLTLGGNTRTSVPRGFDPDHARARYLLLEGLHGSREGPLPASVHGPEFVDECLSVFEKAAPVPAWLKAVL